MLFLNFSTCLETFDAVLDSELLQEFKKLRGLMRVSPRQRLESLKRRWIYGLSSYHNNWQVGFHLGFWRGYPDPGLVYAGGFICFKLQRSEAEARALSSSAESLKEFDAWKRYWPNDFAMDPGFVWAQPLEEDVKKENNNAASLRSVLQPVLNSMLKFQSEFNFPWEKQTLVQSEQPIDSNFSPDDAPI
jgi:hypothetical protein